MTGLFQLFLCGGLLLIGFAIPPMFRLVRPGSIYGLGAGIALTSPEIWYEINQGAGYRMFKAGLATVIASIAGLYIPGLSEGAYYLSCSIVLVGLFSYGVLKTASHMNRLNSL